MSNHDDIPVIPMFLVPGDCLRIRYQFLNDDGSIKPIFAHGARFSVRTAQQVLAFRTDQDELTVNAPDGIVEGLIANGEATAAWPLVAIFYDFAFVLPGGCLRTQFRGPLILVESAGANVA